MSLDYRLALVLGCCALLSVVADAVVVVVVVVAAAFLLILLFLVCVCTSTTPRLPLLPPPLTQCPTPSLPWYHTTRSERAHTRKAAGSANT